VALPVINQALNSLRAVLAAFPEKHAITKIKVECTDNEVVAVITFIGRDKRTVKRYFLERRSDLMPLTGIYLQTLQSVSPQKVYGDDELMYLLPSADSVLPHCRLSYRPGGFAQVNRDQNAATLALVRRMGRFQSDEQILDLFCGNGNFSLPIAGQAGYVTGIEESRISIEAALRNSLLNRIGNAEFICDDAGAATRRLADSGRRYDTVILDPPRTGAAGVIPDICRLRPSKIIYVSCDPSTLARDCALLANDGYDVQESVPVDMFPHTYHIESVTLLLKR
jgi:23S rRNA (uracil1939-C5)-methyltransferase